MHKMGRHVTRRTWILVSLSFILVSMTTSSNPTNAIGKQRVEEGNKMYKQDVETQFLESLKVVTNHLPQKAFCKLLEHFLGSRNISFVSFFQKFPFDKTKEMACGDVKSKYKKNAMDEKPLHEEDLVLLLTRLYNSLPLPFQCSILTTTTLKLDVEKVKQSRQGHIKEKHNSISYLLYKILLSDANEYPTEEKKRRIGVLVKKTEDRLVRQHDLIPIARQCSKLIRDRNAYSNTIKFVVRRRNDSDVHVINRKLHHILQNAMVAYMKENDIKIDTNSMWNTGDKIGVSIFETKKRKLKYIFYFNIYLLKPGSGPRNANIVMTALYQYGKKKISQYLNSHVHFAPVFYGRNKGDTVKRNIKTEVIFPEYIAPYYRSLSRQQQCFIIQMLSVYTNQTKKEMVTRLLSNGRIKKSICLQLQDATEQTKTMTRRVGSTEIPNATNNNKLNKKSSFTNVNQTETVIEAVGFTPIEILMIVSLSCLLIAITVFFVICGVFYHRRREYKDGKSDYTSAYDAAASDLHSYYVNNKHGKPEDVSVVGGAHLSVEYICKERTHRNTRCERHIDPSLIKTDDVVSIDSNDNSKKFNDLTLLDHPVSNCVLDETSTLVQMHKPIIDTHILNIDTTIPILDRHSTNMNAQDEQVQQKLDETDV